MGQALSGSAAIVLYTMPLRTATRGQFGGLHVAERVILRVEHRMQCLACGREYPGRLPRPCPACGAAGFRGRGRCPQRVRMGDGRERAPASPGGRPQGAVPEAAEREGLKVTGADAPSPERTLVPTAGPFVAPPYRA